MSNYTELFERLRGSHRQTYNEAADAIKALQRENAELRKAKEAAELSLAVSCNHVALEQLRKDAERFQSLVSAMKTVTSNERKAINRHFHMINQSDFDLMQSLAQFRTERGDGKVVSWTNMEDGTWLVFVDQINTREEYGKS